MLKSESILKLEELGLNTLDYFITKDKQEVIHYLAKHANDLLSLRTEKGTEWKCPFYFMMPGEKLLPIALKHLGEGYKLILAPSLDTKGCIAFGTVGIGRNADDVIEFVLGEGKVRELDGHKDKRSIFVAPGKLIAVSAKEIPGKAYILNSIFQKAKEACKDIDLPSVVLEWSYYDRPVGSKYSNDIWWEIREYA